MSSSDLKLLTKRILDFRDLREWKQFHNPKDIAISICLEASELLEFTQWKSGTDLNSALSKKREEVGDELSDLLYWTLLMAHEQGIDLADAFERKMRKNEAKYPVAKAKGSSKKYTEL